MGSPPVVFGQIPEAIVRHMCWSVMNVDQHGKSAISRWCSYPNSIPIRCPAILVGGWGAKKHSWEEHWSFICKMSRHGCAIGKPLHSVNTLRVAWDSCVIQEACLMRQFGETFDGPEGTTPPWGIDLLRVVNTVLLNPLIPPCTAWLLSMLSPFLLTILMVWLYLGYQAAHRKSIRQHQLIPIDRVECKCNNILEQKLLQLVDA